MTHTAHAGPHDGQPGAATLPTGKTVGVTIFGASGDLTWRLLLPGLASLLAARGFVHLRLIGSSTSQWDDEKWQQVVRKAISDSGLDDDQVDELVDDARWIGADATDSGDLRTVLDAMDDCDAQVLYLALPPAVAARTAGALKELAPLPKSVRLAMEKPFGNDEKSAHELNELLASFLDEDQIYRMDHFLGEAMVLNLLTMRSSNRLISNAWSSDDIASVDIVYDEEIALEGRAGYYDKAGALKDMLQSHLLEVLAMVAMNIPSRIEARELRDEIWEVLRATRISGDDPVANSRRARYTAGTSQGRDIPDYVDEDGVDPSRGTETLAEMTLEIDNERWAGTPFTLRSGKAITPARYQIILTFREPRFMPEGITPCRRPDRLVLDLSPEKLRLDLSVDGADEPFTATQAALTANLGTPDVEPYGEVLAGLLAGTPLLSVRGDIAEECWRIVDPVLAAWADDKVPMDEYEAGSTGPQSWRTSTDPEKKSGTDEAH